MLADIFIDVTERLDVSGISENEDVVNIVVAFVADTAVVFEGAGISRNNDDVDICIDVIVNFVVDILDRAGLGISDNDDAVDISVDTVADIVVESYATVSEISCNDDNDVGDNVIRYLLLRF